MTIHTLLGNAAHERFLYVQVFEANSPIFTATSPQAVVAGDHLVVDRPEHLGAALLPLIPDAKLAADKANSQQKHRAQLVTRIYETGFSFLAENGRKLTAIETAYRQAGALKGEYLRTFTGMLSKALGIEGEAMKFMLSQQPAGEDAYTAIKKLVPEADAPFLSAKTGETAHRLVLERIVASAFDGKQTEDTMVAEAAQKSFAGKAAPLGNSYLTALVVPEPAVSFDLHATAHTGKASEEFKSIYRSPSQIVDDCTAIRLLVDWASRAYLNQRYAELEPLERNLAHNHFMWQLMQGSRLEGCSYEEQSWGLATARKLRNLYAAGTIDEFAMEQTGSSIHLQDLMNLHHKVAHYIPPELVPAIGAIRNLKWAVSDLTSLSRKKGSIATWEEERKVYNSEQKLKSQRKNAEITIRDAKHAFSELLPDIASLEKSKLGLTIQDIQNTLELYRIDPGLGDALYQLAQKA